MSYPINYPTPQTANFQAFYGNSDDGLPHATWVKPQGVSMVRFLLIGPGGSGSFGDTTAGGGGGGSGAITQWVGPAMFVPNVLNIRITFGGGSGSAQVSYRGRGSTVYNLLTANGGADASGTTGGIAGVAVTSGAFRAAGIYKSTAGQAGANASGSITASTTTFLSGGAGGATGSVSNGGNVATKYGYPALSGGVGTTGGVGADGYFFTQPILIGQGGAGGGGSSTAAGGNGGNGGIGCGGGGGGICTSGISNGGRGGDGAVFIWSW